MNNNEFEVMYGSEFANEFMNSFSLNENTEENINGEKIIKK